MLKPRTCVRIAVDPETGLGAGGGDPPAVRPAELDPEAIARLRELDPHGHSRLLERVVQAFTTSSARLLPQMRAAAASRQLDGVRHVAHTLKSSSASLGATRLSQLCGVLEQQIRAEQVHDLEPQVARIDGEIAAVIQALQQMMDSAA